MERRKNAYDAMKIVQFDLNDVPKNATKFYYDLLGHAMDTGFCFRDCVMGFDYRMRVPKSRLLDEIANTLEDTREAYNPGYPEYWLCQRGNICMITDFMPPGYSVPSENKKPPVVKRRARKPNKD